MGLLAGIMALVGGVGAYTVPAQAVGFEVDGLEACVTSAPCAATLAVGLAAAGVVYAGSSSSQQAGIRTAITQAVNRPNPIDQAGFWTGTQLKNTLAQIISGIQDNIGAGSAAVPLTNQQAGALAAVAADLVVHPLGSGAPADGTPVNVQTDSSIHAWPPAANSWPVAQASQYSSSAVAVFYAQFTLPAGVGGYAPSLLWPTNWQGNNGTMACCPVLASQDVMVRFLIDGAVWRVWGTSGAYNWVPYSDNPGVGYEVRGTDGNAANFSGVDTSVSHVMRVEVMNQHWQDGGLLTAGVIGAPLLQAYCLGSSCAHIQGSAWTQTGVPSSPSVTATQSAGAAALPRSIPVVPGATLGTGTAALGQVLDHPGTSTVTNVNGQTVPVTGTTATTAGAFAGTLTGVSDAIGSVGQTLTHAFDLSRPVDTSKLRSDATLMSTAFPFSIPWDIARLTHAAFDVTPVTPQLSLSLCMSGGHISTTCPNAPTLSLGAMDPFMPFLRWALLVMAIAWVAYAYRRMIGGAI